MSKFTAIRIGHTGQVVHAGISLGIVTTPWGDREQWRPLCKNVATKDQTAYSGIRSYAVEADVNCKRCSNLQHRR